MLPRPENGLKYDSSRPNHERMNCCVIVVVAPVTPLMKNATICGVADAGPTLTTTLSHLWHRFSTFRDSIQNTPPPDRLRISRAL